MGFWQQPQPSRRLTQLGWRHRVMPTRQRFSGPAACGTNMRGSHDSLSPLRVRLCTQGGRPFEIGQRIAYYRKRNAADGEGTNEGYRQGTIVAVEGQTVWVRNTKGRLISAAKEQIQHIAGEEEWWSLPPLEQDLLKTVTRIFVISTLPWLFALLPTLFLNLLTIFVLLKGWILLYVDENLLLLLSDQLYLFWTQTDIPCCTIASSL